MGVIDSKTINKHIDQKFKSIRKYNDRVYGEMTLLQQKSTNKMFSLIQKVIVDQNQLSKIKSRIQTRKQFSQIFMDLHSYYSSKLDYCSNAQKYYFLIQFCDHTLYYEMTLRSQNKNYFGLQEFQKILFSYTEIFSSFKQEGYSNLLSFSNHKVIYQNQGSKIKTIEPFIKCDESQRFLHQDELTLNTVFKQDQFLYYSPQVFQFYCNRQFFRARAASRKEESIVFTLGMNILQCALLANLSGIYDFNQHIVNFDKLDIAIRKMRDIYGQQIADIIQKMLSHYPTQRPTLLQLRNLTKIHPKRRKIILSKHTNVEFLKKKNNPILFENFQTSFS